MKSDWIKPPLLWQLPNLLRVHSVLQCGSFMSAVLKRCGKACMCFVYASLFTDKNMPQVRQQKHTLTLSPKLSRVGDLHDYKLQLAQAYDRMNWSLNIFMLVYA